MSTRVHELAKELGVKSQELLDRIQGWGFEVKNSVFAGLDPALVERIRERFLASPDSESASSAGPEPRASSPSIRASEPSRTTDSPPEGASRPADVVHAAPKPAPTASSPSPSPNVLPPATTPSESGPHPTTTAAASPPPTPTAAPGDAPRPSGAPATSEPARTRPAPPQPPPAPGFSARPASGPGMTAPPQPAMNRPGGPPPPSRAGGAPGGPGSGPLTRQIKEHRSGGHPPGPGDRGHSSPPPSQGRAPENRPELGPRQESYGQQASQGPITRRDYLGPAGTRPISGRPTLPGQQPPIRRSDGDSAGPGQGGEGPRRDGGGSRRPLPSVAAPINPAQPARRPDARPTGPEGKTQRPEMRFTREQLLSMRQTGELPAVPGARPAPGAGRVGPQPPSGRISPGMPPSPSRGGGPGAGPLPLPQSRRPGPPGQAPLAPPPSSYTDEEEERKNKAAGGRLGSTSDRAGRRARRTDRANDRRVTSPLPAAAVIGDFDDDGRSNRARRGIHKGAHRSAPGQVKKTRAEVEPPVTVRSLSEAIGVKANEIIRRLMNTMGPTGLNINASLDEETATVLALDFGIELAVIRERTAEDELLEFLDFTEEVEENLEPRPPVVTILGHVDHGKTSLLDKIRRANVVDTESGGITQHIGAYQVVHHDRRITFVDTPGHEAFTAMRARGANVTDIVVLVVAADDGVMPQTVEAVAHAKAAGVPIIVALNKIDLPNVNINKIFGELSQQDLLPEEYGGDTQVVKTSATTGQGVPDLLEMIGIVAELKCDLRANPKRPAAGTCLEALISEGRGAIARVLVQDGTLRVGDVVVCGDGYGRVRALYDDMGRPVTEAGPSTPVEISGLDEVPTAGEKFGVIDDISRAREIAETRRERSRGASLGERQAITLENLYSKMAEQKVKSLNIILKADVQGSIEALSKELEKLVNPEVPIRVLLKGVGGISESDVVLADASQAIIIGFRVAPEDRAVSLAEEKKIDIRRYDIIYQVTDEIKKAVEGMLIPEVKEVHLGRAAVRQLFKISKVGTVAGCFVTQGTFERSSKVRLIREGREVYKGSLEALKRFKDDVKEVREGFECGIKIANYDDLKVDDIIEAYRVDIIRRTL